MAEERIQSITFSESDVIQIIRTLDVNKAHGHDNISVRMIKLCINSVAHPLTLIFQNSMAADTFPTQWKRANIVPIHKIRCKRVGKKFHALARIIKCMSTNKAQLLMRSFIMSQFSYCPLIWMCHSRKINQINKLHERALRLVYNDKSSSFRELLERHNSVTIHERNIQVLLTEIFKVKSGVAPEIMTEIFKFKDHSHDLIKNNRLERRIIKSCKYGSETVSNLGAKLWDILPETESLQEFKNKRKYWTPLNCPNYVRHIANVLYV